MPYMEINESTVDVAHRERWDHHHSGRVVSESVGKVSEKVVFRGHPPPTR
jgi:hypothetical protein